MEKDDFIRKLLQLKGLFARLIFCTAYPVECISTPLENVTVA